MHPTIENVIASSVSALNPLTLKDLEFIDQVPFNLRLLSSPSDKRGELKNDLEDRKPSHAGLFGGKK
jgi:hypothetical protein